MKRHTRITVQFSELNPTVLIVRVRSNGFIKDRDRHEVFTLTSVEVGKGSVNIDSLLLMVHFLEYLRKQIV